MWGQLTFCLKELPNSQAVPTDALSPKWQPSLPSAAQTTQEGRVPSLSPLAASGGIVVVKTAAPGGRGQQGVLKKKRFGVCVVVREVDGDMRGSCTHKCCQAARGQD